jgi:hypothetical protein
MNSNHWGRPPPKPYRERRRFVRAPLDCGVTLDLGRTVTQGSTINISLGSTFVFAPAIPIGSPVRLTLSFRTGVVVSGVVHSVQQHAGRSAVVVRFTQISPEAAGQIAHYVSEHGEVDEGF